MLVGSSNDPIWLPSWWNHCEFMSLVRVATHKQSTKPRTSSLACNVQPIDRHLYASIIFLHNLLFLFSTLSVCCLCFLDSILSKMKTMVVEPWECCRIVYWDNENKFKTRCVWDKMHYFIHSFVCTCVGYTFMLILT